MNEKLKAVLNALNNIEVRGIQNLTNLAGCISVIDGIIKENETAVKTGDK